MATTLIARPQILSSSTAKLYSIFCHSTRRLVAPTSVLLRRRSNRLQTSLSGSGKSSDPVSSRSGFGRRQLFTKATNVNDAGSIDSPLMQSMEIKIKEHLNAESVTVKDANGDGRHVCIDVISSAFEGQSAVNRQRMVYKAIWEELQTTVHAVDMMTTRTPAEAKSKTQ